MSDGESDSRKDFLLEMYKQTSSHLNRHILITWQSIGVVAGALAIFGLGDKFNIVGDERLDFVTAIVMALCAWSIAHIYDANNWFDRNLHIIANIERQFLIFPSDAKEIHFYFTAHRKDRSKGDLVLHFQIQAAMTMALWALVALFHFYKRVVPGLSSSFAHFEVIRAVPYLVGLASIAYCIHVMRDTRKGYELLRRKSPGKDIATVVENPGDEEDVRGSW